MASPAYGSLPFAEQIAFFRRKVNVNTERWTDLWQEAHDHAFMVAGANRDALVADFRAAIDRVIAEGRTLEDFREDFDAIVTRHGWSYNGGRNWRSRVIFETNLRTSYAAGRWQQLQEIKSWRPYWRYVHSDAVEHPRPLHVKWHDLILHADDPWWQTHYPPNGWGCQCSVESLAERDMRRLGRTVDKAPDDGTEVVTVGARGPNPHAVAIPVGVDPGFGYAPGRSAFERRLHDQAIAVEQEMASPGQWDMLVERSAASQRRPDAPPYFELPAEPGPRLDTADAVATALAVLLGASAGVLDVRGLPVAYGAAVLGRRIAAAPDTTPLLPLLADLLTDPWEVWHGIEHEAATGATRPRTRILKGYRVGPGPGLLLVADEVRGVLQDWRWISAADADAIRALRQGLLWYGDE